MKDPRKPVRTAVLNSLAMKTPHESFRLNTKRGPARCGRRLALHPGRHGRRVGRQHRLPASRLEELAAARDPRPRGCVLARTATPTGRRPPPTAGSSAIDVSDPAVPKLLMHSMTIATHGLSVSDDGKRVYLADVQDGPTQNYVSEITTGGGGMRILDATPIQNRVAGHAGPQGDRLRHLAGGHHPAEHDPGHHQGQALRHRVRRVRQQRPVLQGRTRTSAASGSSTSATSASPGSSAGSGSRCGSGRLAPPTSRTTRARPTGRPATPRTTAASRSGATPASSPARRSSAACGSSTSATCCAPARSPTPTTRRISAGGRAMSAPAFVPSRREIWYADANTGFWVERLSKAAWPTAR